MSGGPLVLAALLLALAAAFEFLRGAESDVATLARRAMGTRIPAVGRSLGDLAGALRLSERLARAGLLERVPLANVLAAKTGAAVLGALFALVVVPAAPGRLALVLALGLPVAGFLAPDAWLEHRARERRRSLRAALPDALDLVAVGAAAGRSPLAGMAEVGRGRGHSPKSWRFSPPRRAAGLRSASCWSGSAEGRRPPRSPRSAP